MFQLQWCLFYSIIYLATINDYIMIQLLTLSFTPSLVGAGAVAALLPNQAVWFLNLILLPQGHPIVPIRFQGSIWFQLLLFLQPLELVPTPPGPLSILLARSPGPLSILLGRSPGPQGCQIPSCSSSFIFLQTNTGLLLPVIEETY